MDLDEWKEKRMEDIEATYKILKTFNPEILLDDFWDKVNVCISHQTFPYDIATKVSAQLEGTGKRMRYLLSFWCWVDPMRAHKSFAIDTDKENEAMIALLSKTSEATKRKIVRVLRAELNTFIEDQERCAESDEDYSRWRMQEPHLQGKIKRVETAIKKLSEGFEPPHP